MDNRIPQQRSKLSLNAPHRSIPRGNSICQPSFFSILLALWSLVTGMSGIVAIPACASDQLVQHQYEGTLGDGRIGMTVVRDGNRIEGGHYFYQKFLEDIPITGSAERSSIVLTEPGGGIFHLHFVGNGSEGGRPLDFENSVGLDGTWASADGTRTYTVSMRGTTIHERGWDGHRYSDITKEGDIAFERRVQSLLSALLRGDKTNAVRFISYPLLVNFPNHTNKKFRNSAAVLAGWNDLSPQP